MSREQALRGKIAEVAQQIKTEDPRAARVLLALASEICPDCIGEPSELATRFLKTMLGGSDTRHSVA